MRRHIDETVTVEDGAIKVACPYANLGEGIYFETLAELQALIERLEKLAEELGWNNDDREKDTACRHLPIGELAALVWSFIEEE